jgi:hypothetical protein
MSSLRKQISVSNFLYCYSHSHNCEKKQMNVFKLEQSKIFEPAYPAREEEEAPLCKGGSGCCSFTTPDVKGYGRQSLPLNKNKWSSIECYMAGGGLSKKRTIIGPVHVQAVRMQHHAVCCNFDATHLCYWPKSFGTRALAQPVSG